MDPSEPHVRRRGFLVNQDTGEPETGDSESAEGITFRVRIVRPKLRHPLAVGAHAKAVPAIGRSSSPPEPSVSTQRNAPSGRLRSATATGSHQQERMHR